MLFSLSLCNFRPFHYRTIASPVVPSLLLPFLLQNKACSEFITSERLPTHSRYHSFSHLFDWRTNRISVIQYQTYIPYFDLTIDVRGLPVSICMALKVSLPTWFGKAHTRSLFSLVLSHSLSLSLYIYIYIYICISISINSPTYISMYIYIWWG